MIHLILFLALAISAVAQTGTSVVVPAVPGADSIVAVSCPDGIAGCLVMHTGKRIIAQGAAATDPRTIAWNELLHEHAALKSEVARRKSDPPLTTEWQPIERQPYNLIEKRAYQFGLRSDGVVVWRKI
jgi:hypothetical protein